MPKSIGSVFIKVFPTKTGKFRARVDYPVEGFHITRRVAEITIGGMKWKNNYLREYHSAILEKMQRTLYVFLGEAFINSENPSNMILQNGNVIFTINRSVL